MGRLNNEMNVKYLVVCLDCFRSMWVLFGNFRGSWEGIEIVVVILFVSGLNYIFGFFIFFI